MKKCQFCAEEISDDSAAACPHCGRALLPTPSAGQITMMRAETKPIAKIFWVLSLLASLVGGAVGLMGVVGASGAPQEAAAAAIGCLIVIAPYAFARAIERLT